MPVARERLTDSQLAEMRQRTESMLKGISFSKEWLDAQPPVSDADRLRITKICAEAWKEAFLSKDEEAQLAKELGFNVDIHARWKPDSFCVWNWWEVSDDVRFATMLEF